MKTKITFSLIIAVIILLGVISCKKDLSDPEQSSSSTEPVLPETPYSYRMSSPHLVALGRVLFFDKKLSLNNSVSCASCHQQEKAFCDNLQFSVGLEDVKTPRNSPSIFAKTSRVFWDGRATSMFNLTLRPIKNHVEMRFEDIQALSRKLQSVSYYPALFKRAFSKDGIDSVKIQSALSAFLSNFDFSDNKFSRSRKGRAELNASEKLGEAVFFNNGRCSNCHHLENSFIPFPNDSTNPGGGGYGFTNESHNIGLDEIAKDKGVGGVFNDPSQYGSFMIPALLNVEFTAPYMHDGRFKTLEEVVEHYNSGIKDTPNLDPILRGIDPDMDEAELIRLFDKNNDGNIDFSEIASAKPVRLGLTAAEKRGLVDFLKTLSDPTIFTEPRFSDPFRIK